MKICLISSRKSFYTKMMAGEFDKHEITYDLFLLDDVNIGTARHINNPFRISKVNAYANLPMWHSLFWKKYFEEIRFHNSSHFDELSCDYRNIDLENVNANNVFIINDPKSKLINQIAEESYEIGVLGRMPIVSKNLLESFSNLCLNAHPGPLPQCRGAGALEQTLYQNLDPAVSIHEVTPDIDAGDIIKIDPVKIEPRDNFPSLTFKLSRQCCISMAETVKELISGKPMPRTPNSGKLHFWKDCTIDVQRIARRKLKSLCQNASN